MAMSSATVTALEELKELSVEFTQKFNEVIDLILSDVADSEEEDSDENRG